MNSQVGSGKAKLASVYGCLGGRIPNCTEVRSSLGEICV